MPSASKNKTPVFVFNRYMVECEFSVVTSVVVSVVVLIDTWWNVNFLLAKEEPFA